MFHAWHLSPRNNFFYDLLPDKVVPDERAHGEQAGHGRGLVREDIHLDGVIAGNLTAGGDTEFQGGGAEEREVSPRSYQDQHD